MQGQRFKSPPQRSDHCPSCQRYAGAADNCPYCDEEIIKPCSIRFLRHASLILGIIGVAFLLLMSRNRELPIIQVADITPTMNFARIRVKGRVERTPYVSKKEGVVNYLSFLLDDGTGTMLVELSGLNAIFASKLKFNMVWSVENGRLKKRTIDGEPAGRVRMILSTMGDRVDEPILELSETRLLLLDADGETKYDWQRVE